MREKGPTGLAGAGGPTGFSGDVNRSEKTPLGRGTHSPSCGENLPRERVGHPTTPINRAGPGRDGGWLGPDRGPMGGVGGLFPRRMFGGGAAVAVGWKTRLFVGGLSLKTEKGYSNFPVVR